VNPRLIAAVLACFVQSQTPAATGPAPASTTTPTNAPYARCNRNTCAGQVVPKFSAPLPNSSFVATSAIGGIADASVLENLIATRVGLVTQQVLLDIMKAAIKDNALPEVAADLAGTFGELATAAAEKETLTQVVTTGVLRVVLTGAAWAIPPTVLDPGCVGLFRLDAAYEGLAASKTLHGLGFTAATGTVSTQCTSFAASVTQLADLIGAIGDTTTTSLKNDIATFKAACPSIGSAAAAPGGAPGLGLNFDATSNLLSLRTGIQAVRNGNPMCTRLSDSLLERLDALQLNGVTNAGFQSATIDSAVGSLTSAQLPSDVLQALEAIVYAIAHAKPVSRGDVVTLVTYFSGRVDDWWPESGGSPDAGNVTHKESQLKDIVDDFFRSLPDAIQTDPKAVPVGLRLDGVSLASEMVTFYVDDGSPGLYLRATLGTGVLLGYNHGASTPQFTPSLHEELGFGYRWSLTGILGPNVGKHYLVGPHLGVSGLLYRLELNSQATDNLFFFGGVSANFYHLIDVSASAGLLHNTSTLQDRFGLTLRNRPTITHAIWRLPGSRDPRSARDLFELIV
jgi:hypothetical protein